MFVPGASGPAPRLPGPHRRPQRRLRTHAAGADDSRSRGRAPGGRVRKGRPSPHHDGDRLRDPAAGMRSRRGGAAAGGRLRRVPGPALRPGADRGARAVDLQPRHRAARPPQLRSLPSAGRGRPVQPAELRRRQEARPADREGDREPVHAALASRARLRRLRRRHDGSVTTTWRSLRRWVESGAPEGSPAERPEPPRFAEGWQLGPPDLVLRAGPAATRCRPRAPTCSATSCSTVPRAGPALRPRAWSCGPGTSGSSTTPTCSSIAPARPADRTRATRAPASPAWTWSWSRQSFEPDSHFLFWKPGTAAVAEPADMAWRVDPSTDLVLNLHLQPSGKPEVIQPDAGAVLHRSRPDPLPDAGAARARRSARHPRGTAGLRRDRPLRPPGGRRGAGRLSPRPLSRTGREGLGHAPGRPRESG